MPDTFRPARRDDEVVAGGVRLFEATPEGHLVFVDRYRRRCNARGTDDVRVSLWELLDLLTEFYEGLPGLEEPGLDNG